VAPAGSGKSMLLRSWVEDAGLSDRVGWVSVERDEYDAQRFWVAVVNALRATASAKSIARLEPSPEFDGRAVVNRLLSDLGSVDGSVILVIDDLHELTSREALDQLELLLARRPPALRVVLATRNDPHLGLHRLRVTGQLTELRLTDLRFTLDETRQLLHSAGIQLADPSIARLHERAEGWAAGLRLAALSLARHPDPERFVTEFSGNERTVADYLLIEVLDRQPVAVRQLLLRTSLVERVNGPLADALTGSSGSEDILLDLERGNAFVTAIDADRTWFRYHHLFSDLLQLQLRREHPELVARLHLVAAAWHEKRGYVVDAIRHFEAAEDWSGAVRMLADHAFSLILEGQLLTSAVLVDAFPPEMRSDPQLAWVIAGIKLMQSSLDDAAAYLAIAERHADAVRDERVPSFELGVATVRLAVDARRGDYGSVTGQAQALLDRPHGDTEQWLALNNDARAMALMNLGIVEYWSHQLDDARRHLGEALELAHRIGRPRIEIICLAHLGLGEITRSIDRQRELAAAAVAVADEHGWASDPVATMALASMGAADIMQGRFAEARQWVARAESALRPGLDPSTELLVTFLVGMLDAGEGRLRAAIEAFRSAAGMQARLVTLHVVTLLAHQFTIHAQLRLPDLDGARATLELLSADERAEGEIVIAEADLRLCEGDAAGALALLAPVLTGTTRVLGNYTMIQARIIEALAHDRLTNSAAATAAIEHALDLAEPDAMVFPFVLTAPRSLVESHPRHDTRHAALLSDILDVLAGSSRAPRARVAELSEELTESELRVLRFLPSNLSAPEIAAELYVSTSTVKTHMRHIYAKLDAHGRSAAVQRARELGLLARPTR
jgi:LuxR family maltose regulon positive regulatory protein